MWGTTKDETIGYKQEIKNLKEKVRVQKEELEDVKFQKNLKIREAEHLVKMKLEKQDIEYVKKENELKSEFNKKEMELQKTYFEEMKGRWAEEQANMKGLYDQILQRLPDISMHVGGEVRR